MCDGFHPKVPLDLTKGTRGEVVDFLDKVGQCGRWPQQARTTMFFLIPKSVTSERPIALLPAMIRRVRSASARYLEMATGIVLSGMPRMGVEEAHCGDLAGDGQIQLPWNQRDQGAMARVLDLAKAVERASCDIQDRKINFTNSNTLVGWCRDRPSRALPQTCPNAKNRQKKARKNKR